MSVRARVLGAGLAVLLAGLALVLAACSDPEPVTPSYLTAEIPPCTPANGAPHIDPCATDTTSIRFTDTMGHIDFGDEPLGLADFIGVGYVAAQVVVRATYLPNTVRCVVEHSSRHPSWWNAEDWDIEVTKCFVDVRVNSYILGSGPTTLSLMVAELHNEDDRVFWEQDIIESGIIGSEEIMFLGAAWDFGSATYAAFGRWHLEDRDGVEIAVHPHRDDWLRLSDSWQSSVEMTLADFKRDVAAAHTARIAKYGGRLGNSFGENHANTPKVQTDANKLQDFYIDAGATEHEDGPPKPPPPSCGKAVPSQLENPSLMLDCVSLLGVKDELRGDAALNWSEDVAMGEWDGLRIEDGRVVALDLGGEGLTGCVPPSLREMAVDGLDELGLPECAG